MRIDKEWLEAKLRAADNTCTRAVIRVVPPQGDQIEWDLYFIGKQFHVLRMLGKWQTEADTPLFGFNSSEGDRIHRELTEFTQISAHFGKLSMFMIKGEISMHGIKMGE